MRCGACEFAHTRISPTGINAHVHMHARVFEARKDTSCSPSLWHSEHTQALVHSTLLRKHTQYCLRHLILLHRHLYRWNYERGRGGGAELAGEKMVHITMKTCTTTKLSSTRHSSSGAREKVLGSDT
jgi:hypothetical protein